MAESIYGIEVYDLQGKPYCLEQYRDHVLLIVNTATQCGLAPQLAELESLYQEFKAQNFLVLGFPCNQFAAQEPLESSSIAEVCLMNYGVTFPMHAKIMVNGDETHPLYKMLKQEARGLLGTQAIKWNFTKFLVNKKGQTLRRFAPQKNISHIKPYVIQALKN